MRTAAIHDLAREMPADPVAADVCIVGAGPVGLTLACALMQRGRSVVLLDAGAATPVAAVESPDLCFDRRVYRGATLGRALGLGGTSALWGGQLLPVRDADLLARPQIGAPAWPITHRQIEPYFTELQTLLGIAATGFDLASSGDAARTMSSLDFTGWSPRLSKWLPFGRRNLAVAWRRRLTGRPGAQIWLNARVNGWELDDDSGRRRVRELIARAGSGQVLRVQPAATVIAGGALEAARSVIELNSQAQSLGAGVGRFAGRFLHDHLSLRIARVRMRDPAAFEARFAPFFEGSIMRSLRMELPPEVLAREGLPALYAHFIAVAPADSGFAVVRDCLRALQRRDPALAFSTVVRAPGALPDVAKILHTRWVQRRLAFPAGSELFLHVDLEQAARYDNRVYLGVPPAGARPPLHVDWDVQEDRARIARSVRGLFETFWARNALDHIATLEFSDADEDPQAWNDNVYDLYHPAGTTRMALGAEEGVVDENLRVHGTANAYVAGSSVFPSMGAANPTFTAMALALRLAHFIAQAGR